jgi:hypothetical protein
MGKMALGLAALAAAVGMTAPAAADPGFVAQGPLQGAAPPSNFFGGSFSGGHGHGGGGGGGGVWVNGGEWAKYNNEAFKSDGFNGWWHDRPDRAYPAWMRNNQNCQRQWYAGNTLRC